MLLAVRGDALETFVLRWDPIAMKNLAWITAVLLLLPSAPAQAASPYPSSSVITSITWNWATHIRRAPGSDNWPVTWGPDDHLYTSWGDGGGFSGNDSDCRVALGFGRLEGSATSFVGNDLWGDPGCADFPAQFDGKTRTVLYVNGTLYFWRSPGSDVAGLDFQRLYKSTNAGASFTDTGVEFNYATHRIGLFAFLQFGKNYQGARDGYVYIYATNIQSYSWGTQTPGEIYLLRVPTSGIEVQSQYQFFRGKDASGNPLWGTFSQRVPVFTDPNGVMRNSAAHDPSLGRYLLVTNHTQNNSGNVAIFDAPEPWGPWTTVQYATGWPSGGQVTQNTFFANFATKFWSNGGKDFVFVFTGKESNDSFNSVQGTFGTGTTTSDITPPAAPNDLRTP